MYGLRVHEAVLASGARVSGPTVHLVDEAYDRGLIIAQWPVPVLASDTPHSLAARVLHVEHLLYPRVVDHMSRALARGQTSTPFSPCGERFLAAPGTIAGVEQAIAASFAGEQAK